MRRALLLALALGACSAPVQTINIPHMFDRGGIALNDRPLRIDFGRTEASTISAVTKLRGAPSSVTDCPGGRVANWPDGTALYFANGDFRGWRHTAQSTGFLCGSGDR